MQIEQDPEQIQGWLRRLCPPGTPGQLVICSHSDWLGARFDVDQLHTPLGMSAILSEIRRRDRDKGIYLRMSTIRPGVERKSRGTADDSLALFGLWADIDIDGPGHKHDPSRHGGRRLPPDEDAARQLVDRLPEPTAWVRSGGGLYPFWLPKQPWLLDEPGGPGRTAYAQLSVDLQAEIGQRAAELGWHYGTGVGDIARVLRIPGTVNRKAAKPRPCEIEWGGGPTYTYRQLRDAIPHHEDAPSMALPTPRSASETPPGISARPTTRLVGPKPPEWVEQPGTVGPLDDFAARHDLCQLLEADGWTFAYEHNGRRHYVRPGKDRRGGVSGNVIREGGRQVLYVFSEAAGLPTNRGLSVGEWYAHRYHAGSLSEAARTLRAAGYGTAPTMALGATGKPSETADGGPAAPALPVPARTAADELWDRRPVLRAIRRAARERMVGPWAVLGVALAQVACRVGPHVVLPPIIGGRASLNLFVGLVGRSGAGKDAAMAVASDLLEIEGKIAVRPLGTGQGIAAAYTVQTKEGPVQYCDSVLFEATEIDSLAAHSSMAGSTVLPNLRAVYTGSQLGEFYADKFKRRPVRAHHYRAALVVGIQPARAGVLLDDADGGTPQRFLWLPTNDPEAGQPVPARLVGPAPARWWTDYEIWSAHGEQDEDAPVERKPEIQVKVCDTATNLIRNTRLEALRRGLTDDGDGLQGHALLTRLKVAALLGLLDGRCEVSEDDWELSALVMLISEQTRAQCQSALAQKAAELAAQRGRARARATAAEQEEAARISDEQEDRLQSSILPRLLRKLQEAQGQWVSRRDLSRFLGRDGSLAAEALGRLVQGGQAEANNRGSQYRARTL